MPGINDFIENQLEGEVVAQDLEFSLSPEKAREKMRSFQKELPCYALMRLAQGLFQMKASSLDFEILDKSVIVTAGHHFESDFGDKVMAALEAPPLDKLSPENLVATALHCLQLDGLSSLGFAIGKKSWSVIGDETHSVRTGHFELHLQRSKPSIKTGQIISELSKRCRLMNCEVKVGGTLLRPTPTPTLKAHQKLAAQEYYMEWVKAGRGFLYDVVLIEDYKPADGVQILQQLQPSADTEMGPFFYGGLPANFAGKDLECEMAVGLQAPLKEATEGILVVIQHGVIVEAIRSPDLLPDSIAIVELSHLKTDLSGLRVVRDAELEDTVKKAVAFQAEVAVRAADLFPVHAERLSTITIDGFKTEIQNQGCLAKILMSLLGQKIQQMEKKVEGKLLETAQKESERLKKWLDA